MIDRVGETEIVEESLREAGTGQAGRAVFLEFYGLAGIGKTYLLDYNRRQAAARGIPSARVNVQTLGQARDGAQCRLTEAVVDQLLNHPGGPALDAYREIEDKAHRCQGPLPETLLQSLAGAFMDYLTGWLKPRRQAVLLIFDETDRFPPDVLRWLNREVFAQLVAFGNLVVIFAGRAKLQAEQLAPDVRAALRSRAVIPFKLDDTREQIRQSAVPQYAPEAPLLQGLTHGHPKSSVSALAYLQDQKLAALEPGSADMARHLRDEIIHRYIFDRIDDRLQSVLRLVAYPRRFDTSLLAELMRRYGAGLDYEPDNPQSMTNLITYLTLTLLVAYDPSEGGYKLDPLLAKLIQTGDLLTDPQRFMEVHAAMAQWHLELPLDSRTGSDVRSVGDGFYHLAQHYRGLLTTGQRDSAGAQADLKERLHTVLRQRYSSANLRAYERTNELRDRFKSDMELANCFPGVLDTLNLVLADFIMRLGQAPRAMLTIINRVNLDVSLNVPDQAIVLNEYSLGLSQAGKLQLTEVLADLEAATPTAGRLMFNLCMPLRIQEALGAVPLPLQIVTNYADQPWELMHDGSEYLCLKLPLGRMPVMEREPRRPQHKLGAKPRFLLVADPTGNLPGARDEIAALQAQLDGQAEITPLVGAGATRAAFFKQLAQNDPAFDVIHYAGHAEFDLDHPQESRLQFSDGPVHAYEIGRTLKYRPLVFLNACAAGYGQSGENYMGSYTEGLVTSFLLGGARACIGPLWRVPDGAARNFAVTFYTQALAGVPLGEALRRARLQSRAAEPETKVWAAYVLYGNPTDYLLQ